MKSLLFLTLLLTAYSTVHAHAHAQFIDTVYYDADHHKMEKELKAFAAEFEVRNFKSRNNRTGTVERHDIYGGIVSEYTLPSKWECFSYGKLAQWSGKRHIRTLV